MAVIEVVNKNHNILYEHLYDSMYKFRNSLGELSVSESKKKVAHGYNIPYFVWNIILEEMYKLKWIKKNRFTITLIKRPFNVMDNTAKVCQMVGLF